MHPITLENAIIFFMVFITLWAVDCANRAYKQRNAMRLEYQMLNERWRVGDLSTEMRRVTYWRHFTDLLVLADWRKAYGRALWAAAPHTFGVAITDSSEGK